MRLKQILLGFLGLGLLAACSQDDVVPSGADNGNGKTDGYLAVKINLPQTRQSRALNDIYDDGLADEYKVGEDVSLIIFTGENETTATQTQAYLLSQKEIDEDHDNDNVTDAYSYLKAVKVGHFGEGRVGVLS